MSDEKLIATPDRSAAMNLVRTMQENPEVTITRIGIATLATAVLRMDKYIEETAAQPVSTADFAAEPSQEGLGQGELVAAAARTACNWVEDIAGLYDTTCGNRFSIEEGTPTENVFTFCCYCGKPLTQTTE